MIMSPINFIHNFLKKKVTLINGSLGNDVKLKASPENKKKFVHYIFERNNHNCQFFTITHDPFIISIENA